MKVAGVTFSQETASFVTHLDSTDKSGATVRVPILVGEREASVLNMKLSRQSPPRPLTHDLAVSFVSTLGGQIKYVVIEDIQEGIFLARIYLTDNQGNLRSVDSRASDAIIFAVTAGIEIHAARKVLDKAGVKPEKPATSALSI
jgi:hypothetical protein